MASFRTEIEQIKAPIHLNYDDVMLSLGSCFSDNIGLKLRDAKFNITANPLGVLYNPISIKQSIEILIGEENYDENKLIEQNGLWQSFDFHSSFSDIDKHRCLTNIQESISSARIQLKHLSTLVITFGTAYFYRLNDTGQVVANCHKFPATHFTRKRLSISQIIDEYLKLIEKLQKRYPALKIIFTLSPIRHLKDGFEENQVSKSILRVAIDEICKSTNNTHYFPSFEILLDDLRDYRFYQADLVHPNDLAIDYIWKKFQGSYFDTQTMSIMKSVSEISSAANHRPLHAESEQHQVFKKVTLNKILELQTNYPQMNWDREIEVFDN